MFDRLLVASPWFHLGERNIQKSKVAQLGSVIERLRQQESPIAQSHKVSTIILSFRHKSAETVIDSDEPS